MTELGPLPKQRRNRMRNLLVCLAPVLVAACATAEPMKTPSGRMGYVIACEAGKIEQCYAKAAEVCPGGYVLYDRTGLTMLIECK
jgi:hypothetical protein